MNSESQQQAQLRQLPGVNTLLEDMAGDVAAWGHTRVKQALRDHLSKLRKAIRSGETPKICAETIKAQVITALASLPTSNLMPVFNLTGIVLHSNLGRANLSASAIAAVQAVAQGASNLEFDLTTGKRGDREADIEAIICELTGAEAATVVNNNAAAVLLALNTLAMGHEVPVSRGELVEIGGSFRVPDIMARAGCALREVGTTNRTHLTDYESAIGKNTALLMKVHSSNYRIEGFTATPTEGALADLAADYKIPFMIDLGSGNLIDFKVLGLPEEPTVAHTLQNGADLVTFSGDKLLGGPQAGLIAGRADLIAQLKVNPLKRALRLDKMTLAALIETLKLYRHPEQLHKTLPTLRLITRDLTEIRTQAESLRPHFIEALGSAYHVDVGDALSQIGSGSLPVETLPSAALTIRASSGEDSDLRTLHQALRQLPKPVIGRLHDGALRLDIRCLETHESLGLIDQLSELRL